MAKDVFISYCREDRAMAYRLYALLAQRNISPWMADQHMHPGQDWPTAITEGIRRSRLLLLVVSKNLWKPSERQFVAGEVAIAKEMGLGIIVFRLDNVYAPPEIDVNIRSSQWIDAFGERLDVAAVSLVAAIQGSSGYAAPTDIFPRSPEAAPVRRARSLWSALATVPAGASRILKLLKPKVPSLFLPEEVKTDEVFFTLTAPGRVRAGTDVELLIWAHLQQYQRLVLLQAMASLRIAAIRKLLWRSYGPIDLKRGTNISVVLQIEGIPILNAHNQIRWTGAIGIANFILSVPGDADEGTRKGICFIRVNGIEIGRIDFLLQIGKGKLGRQTIPADLKRYRRAFASYASEDRDAVLAHVHGMQKISPNLDVFVDVMKLRSGELWTEKLNEAVQNADVFYLFWCRHALRSEWVEKEWRLAYNSRGPAFIDPVPLESPDVAPPPLELSGKHFYDSLLAFAKHASEV